ncbi:MAG: hypothetical protein ABW252_25330 [Polyangiales bacterium]
MNKLIILSLLTVTGCAEFEPGSLLTETRVLGAKVQVAGDPERATPRPGETADLTFVIEGVTPSPVVRWSLAVCLPTSAPAPCSQTPLTSAAGAGTTPSVRLVVPADSALGDARTLHVSGVICTEGEPDDGRGGCVGDGAEGTPLVYELALARGADGGDLNRQPNVQQTRLRFDGKAWNEGTALVQGCAAQPELPQAVANEKEHRITIELGPDARELYMGPGGRATYEELQLSTFVDAGELERQFSFVSPTDARARPTVELKWTAPKQSRVQTADRGVRFVVLVRDGRGGLARIERAICAVRASSGQVSAALTEARPDSAPR